MKEFRTFINDYNTDKSIESIIAYFVDNEWFGEEMTVENGRIMLTEKQIALFTKQLNLFLDGTEATLYIQFQGKYPATAKLFDKFLAEIGVDDEFKYHITDK